MMNVIEATNLVTHSLRTQGLETSIASTTNRPDRESVLWTVFNGGRLAARMVMAQEGTQWALLVVPENEHLGIREVLRTEDPTATEVCLAVDLTD